MADEPQSQPPAIPTAPAPAPLEPGHAHPALPKFRFIEELKRRNVGRVAILYVVIGYLILEVFGVFVHLLELPAWIGRSVVLLMAIGFPIALLIAWIYEITPEGLKPTEEVAPQQSIRHQTGKRLDRAIIAALAIALSYFVVDKFWHAKNTQSNVPNPAGEHATTASEHSTNAIPPSSATPTPAPSNAAPEKSVAVLPFLDMSEKKDQEYFSDGLSEQLIDMLVKVPELRVPARTSSFYFKNRSEDIPTIAKRLMVANVLEGSVRKAGNHLRVTAQLVRADNGYHLWSETYDRKVDDIFKVQDEIAGAVVAALKVSLLTTENTKGVGTSNVAAYELYLQARAIYFRAGTREDFETMIAYLERSLQGDSDFAPAWALLCVAQAMLAGNYSDTVQEQSKHYQDARHSARQALALDDKLPEAHTAMGRVLFNDDRDWDGALLETRRALMLDPGNALTLYWMGNVLFAMGRVDQALEYYEKSVTKDPLNPHAYSNLGAARAAAGQYAAAEAAYRKALDLNPNEPGIHGNIGTLMLLSSRASEALAEFERDSDKLTHMEGRVLTLYALGRKPESDAAMALLEQAYGDTAPYDIAQVRAFRGEKDLAFTALERAREQNAGSLWTVKIDPLLKGIRSDPRYAVFLKKLNLPL